MAEQQINVAQQDTLEAIDNKIDILDTVADNIYAKVDSEVAAINAGLEEVKKSVSDGKSAIATAITNKGMTTSVNADFATMASNIDDIVTLKEGTSDATVAANKMLSGVIGYGKDGVKVTGNIPSKAAATITPGASAQTIAAGQYLTGVQTIAGDADLISANIKSGANIFGVAGNSNVVDTSSGTATAAQILSGAKAWVDGKEITGSMVNKGDITTAWGGYETITVQPHPADASQGLITISNQYNIPGFYNTGSKITGNMANLNASNIKAGVAVGQVNGNSSNSIVGTFTSDATATATDIMSGKIAYSKGNKLVGTAKGDNTAHSLHSVFADLYNGGSGSTTLPSPCRMIVIFPVDRYTGKSSSYGRCAYCWGVNIFVDSNSYLCFAGYDYSNYSYGNAVMGNINVAGATIYLSINSTCNSSSVISNTNNGGYSISISADKKTISWVKPSGIYQSDYTHKILFLY